MEYTQPPRSKAMNREDCRIGMIVEFGRENGQRTKGVIVKMNPKKAKIRIIESRGAGRGSQTGSLWVVSYGVIVAAQDATTETTIAMQSFVQPNNPAFKAFAQAKSMADQPVPYNPFTQADNLILEAIYCTHMELSPENLSCDGELPAHVVNARRSKLNARLTHLYKAFGREVGESASCNWMDEKRSKETATSNG
jgi:hypothetical protein